MIPRGVAAFALVVASAAADAEQIVRACGSDTEAGAGLNLADALARGGLIYVACPATTRLRITRNYTVPANTVLHGNGTAVLDGSGTRGTFLSSTAGTLAFRRITLANFQRLQSRPAEPGHLTAVQLTGSIGSAQVLELDDVRVENSQSPFDAKVSLTLRRSRFTGNSGTCVNGRGSATVDVRDTVFVGNESAISLTSGTIQKSAFIDHAQSPVRVSYPSGRLVIRTSEFRGTRGAPALQLTQRAGRAGLESALIRANTFVDNRAGAIRIYDSVSGAPVSVRGALAQLPPAAYVLAYNRFTGNRSAERGAAIDADLANARELRIIAGLFVENAAGVAGGAIAIRNGDATVVHGVFKGNSAANDSAIEAAAGSTLTLANSLFVGHPRGGNVIGVAAGQIVNVTIADNAGIAIVARGTPAAVTVGNTILSNNAGGQCRGLAAAALSGRNLQFGASDCPGVPVGNPFLDRLYVPAEGSPALALGDASVCRSAPVSGRDLLFQLRESGADCALGAYERPPTRALKAGRERPPRVAVDGRVPDALADIVERPLADGAPDARAVVITAWRAEARAPAVQVDLAFRLDGSAQRHNLDRVGRDRLRLRMLTSAGVFESVRVGTQMVWREDNGPWREGPAPIAPRDAPQIELARLFDTGFVKARDLGTRDAGGRRERVVGGDLSWGNAGVRNAGTVVVAIDVAAGLPTELLFHGTCGGRACAFHQRMRYDDVAVELPAR